MKILNRSMWDERWRQNSR